MKQLGLDSLTDNGSNDAVWIRRSGEPCSETLADVIHSFDRVLQTLTAFMSSITRRSIALCSTVTYLVGQQLARSVDSSVSYAILVPQGTSNHSLTVMCSY